MTGWKVPENSKNGFVKCSLCKAPDVYLEQKAHRQIELLMEAYPSQEWMGYLEGQITEGRDICVEKLSIPPHKEANTTSAEAEPFHIPDKCVGVIHSHHSMGAFHSSTDKDYVDKNFPVSVTVAVRNRTLEYDVACYAVTPCGRNTSEKGAVKYVLPPPTFDEKAFVEESKKKIDKGTRTAVVRYGGYGAYGGYEGYFGAAEATGMHPYFGSRLKPIKDWGKDDPKGKHRRHKQQEANTSGEIWVDEKGHVLSDGEVKEILAQTRLKK